MKEYLQKVSTELKSSISRAHAIACARRVPMYLVGGFVRDLLLGVGNLDLDIVVEGDAIECARAFASASKARVVAHARFGTATVMLGPRSKVDFATARKECYPEPASLPVVTPGTLREDLARRDFTINAMAIGIGAHGYGELVDLFNGRQDLRKGLVRVLHELSFIDDPTRILRAVRFEARYSFVLEKETLKFLRDAVSLKMLEKVQPQRVRDELVLMLKEKKPLPELRRLRRLVGFGFIHSGLGAASGGLRLCAALEPQVRWLRRTRGESFALDTWVVYGMALCDGLSRAQLAALCARFVFLKGEQDKLLEYKQAGSSIAAALSSESIAPSKVHALLAPLSCETVLMIRVKFPDRLVRQRIGKYFALYSRMRPHIGGQDLMRMGLTPGPRFGKILRAVLDARLDGKVDTRQEELRLASELARP